MDPDAFWGYTLNLYLLNKSGRDLMFSADEASVNGFMIDPFYATSVQAGTCHFSNISWSNSRLEENKIAAVEELEFRLHVRGSEDWSRPELANELIQLNTAK